MKRRNPLPNLPLNLPLNLLLNLHARPCRNLIFLPHEFIFLARRAGFSPQ